MEPESQRDRVRAGVGHRTLVEEVSIDGMCGFIDRGHHTVGGAPGPGASAAPVFDPSLCWRLHPQVAVRPEPFGALLYHFGTRKLRSSRTG